MSKVLTSKLLAVAIVVVLGVGIVSMAAQSGLPTSDVHVRATEKSGFVLVAPYPHDNQAFTQGLDFHK